MLYYGPTLIREIGLKGDTVSLVVSGGIGIVQFIAVLPAIVYIDSVGRKALLRGERLWFTTDLLTLHCGLLSPLFDDRIMILVIVPWWDLTFGRAAELSRFSLRWRDSDGMFPPIHRVAG